jgi:predicted  nucleic acid-binding Zn-ribbon protein
MVIEQLNSENQNLQLLASKLPQYKNIQDKLSGEIRSLKLVVASQKDELSEKSQEAVNVHKECNQSLRQLKRERQEKANLAQQLEHIQSQIAAAQSAVEVVHSFLETSHAYYRFAVIEKMQPLFARFALAPIAARQIPFQVCDRQVASIEPVADEMPFELDQLRSELLKFPIDQPIARFRGDAGTARERIGDLKATIRLVQQLFAERERNIEQMAQIVASQHHAVMKLTKRTDEGVLKQEARRI